MLSTIAATIGFITSDRIPDFSISAILRITAVAVVSFGQSRLHRIVKGGSSMSVSLSAALSEPTANPGLVTRILLLELALKEPFFPWDHNQRDAADSWNERHQ